MENQKEIWKDVVGYEGLYQVSNLGRVKSLKHGKERILRDAQNSNGYPGVVLCIASKGKTKMVHRLVAEAFLGKSDLDVNHKDGKPSNNNIENLEYVTTRENISHGYKSKKTSSNYVGVSLCKTTLKWKASIYINSKRIELGRFNTELEAYNAYLKVLEENKIKSKYA